MCKNVSAKLSGLTLVAFQAVAAAPVSVESLLEEMTDRTRIAEYPATDFRCMQCSSYNREAVARDQPGWFANADSSFFYGHQDVDGRREWIMMDVDGPGAIVRWWVTQWKFSGTVRIYLDQASTPVYEATADKLIGGDVITGKPLSNVVGHNGRNLYLPIPFSKHCRITYDGVNSRESGKFEDCIYYNINYVKYPEAIGVKTFAKDDLQTHADLLATVQKALLEPDKNTLPVARTVKGKKQSLGKGENLVCDIDGSGAISSLRIKLDAPDPGQAMRSVAISIRFDGKERVLAPLGGFFGCGPGLNPYKDWWKQVDPDGWMSCRWPMPFRKNARVTIVNYGDSEVSVELGDVGVSEWEWTPRTMYFNSSWHSENRMKTGTPFDWNYLTVEGKGVYVGDTLALFNRAVLPHPKGTGTWWGEGDEKITVDREVFPSSFGTGTEDYYGYSWGVGGSFSAPFHAMPRGHANGNYTKPGHTTNTRVRSLDRIPFSSHLQVDMEVLHWQKEAVVDYAATTHWYAMDGAIGNRMLTPDAVRVKIGDMTGWKQTEAGDSK